MLRTIAFLILTLGAINSTAQDIHYVDLPQTVIAKDIAGTKSLRSSYFGSQMNQVLNTFLNVYSDNKASRESVESVRGKTEIVKEAYAAYDIFPDSILTGWHDAIATDHQNFCSDVKVRVEKNKIVEFVIDGCIRIGVHSIGTIKKGKCAVTLEKFNGEETEMMNVYFLRDLEEPALVDEPMQPGYICFWTDKKGYMGERIILNGLTMNGVQALSMTEPECFDQYTTVTLILRPAVYTFLAKKSGNDREASFEVKSGKCLHYRLP